MPNKKVARIDIIKAIAGVSFTTLAAIGGSSGHPLLAGLAALPAAGLAAHNTLGDRLARLKSQKEKYLEIPPPFWWIDDFRSWQNLCAEVENRLPQILWIMQENMQREEQVMTRNRVREVFIEAFAVQYLAFEHDVEQKKRIADFLAIPILKKLDEVLQPIIEQIQQEAMLTNERKTALNTEQTVRVLEKIHEQVSSVAKPHALNDEEMAILRKQYYDDRAGYWKMLDFKGIMRIDMNRPISIPLTEVFILSDVLSGVPEYETLERETEEFRYGSHTRKAKLAPPQRESLQTVLAKYRRLVILGDPGSGKSTLLKYLLLQLVQGSDNFAATFPQMYDIAAMVPLYMQLAAFAEVLLSNAPGTRSLEDFLPIYLHDNYLDAYVNFIQTQLERGNVFLLFDGLDEIPDAALRMSVVRHIEMFTQAHAANRFIVTSRIVGYKEASLSSEYQPYTLADFNEDQVKNFTQRWCPAYERWVNDVWDSQSIKNAATREAEKLFYATQCKPAVKRLAVNPLLLTILALIQRQGIDLPSHRVELFELCAITLIDTWVRAKGQSTHFSKNELIKILRPLAFWMHQHPAVGNIPEEELREQIVQQLIGRSINDYEATKVAEQFLETVRGKTGILVERGKERYGFLHLTFEEYFAALELEKRKDRNEFIRKHLHDPRWREVILLTVGAIGILRSNEEEVTELVYNMIAKAGSAYEWALHRDLLFAGLCIADDVGIRVDRENEIIEQIVYLSLTSPYNGLQRACSSVLVSWSGTRVGERAANLVLPILRQWVTTTDSSRIFVATTRLEEKLNEHIEQLAARYQVEMIRHLRFQLTIILVRLQMLDGVDWVTNLFGILSAENERAKVSRRGSDNQLSIIDVLLIVLSDPDTLVRRQAIGAFGYLGNMLPNVIDALVNALSDFDIHTREAAINALRLLDARQPYILNALLAAYNDYPLNRKAALDALCHLNEGQPEIIDAMLLALVDLDSTLVRRIAGSVLKRLNHNEQYCIDILLSIISEPHPQMKEALAHILARLGSNSDTIFNRLLSSFTNTTNAKEVAIRAIGYLGEGEPRITEILLPLLSEDNKYIRAVAIEALGHHGDGQAHVIDAILSMLSDSSWQIRREAVKTLEQLGMSQPRVIEAVLATLSDSDEDVREAAASALGRLDGKHPLVLEALLSAMDDPFKKVRNAAADALGRLDVKQSFICLEAILSTFPDQSLTEVTYEILEWFSRDQPHIISHLLTVLSNLSKSNLVQRVADDYRRRLYGSYIKQVLSLLKDVESNQPQVIDMIFAILFASCPDYLVINEAARALGHLSKKKLDIIDNLLSLLSDSNWIVRMGAAQALGELDKDEAGVISVLLSILSNSDSQERGYAALALGKLGKGHPQVVDALLKALTDNGPNSGSTRQLVANALGQLGDSQVHIIEALLQVLFSPSWVDKQGVAFALGKLGKGQIHVIDALLPALSSSDLIVRAWVARILGNLDDKQARIIDALLSMVSDPNWLVREETSRALGELDDRLSRSLDALLCALSDSSSTVRQAAAYALKSVDSGDTHAPEALLHAFSDSDWSVRGAAAYALAASQNDVEAIGDRIEQLLRKYEPIAHRELRDYNLIFDALRAIAEKLSSSRSSANGSKQ